MDDRRYHTKAWRQLRTLIIRRDGVCATPGCTTDTTRRHALVVDHIHEVKDGGDFWNPANLQLLCKPCHNRKTEGQKQMRARPVSPNA